MGDHQREEQIDCQNPSHQHQHTHEHEHDHDHDQSVSVENLSPRQKLVDYLGSVLGVLCAVHCMLTPAIIALLPLSQLAILWSEDAEHILFGSIAVLATFSAVLSVWKTRSWTLFFAFTISLSMMLIGHHLNENHEAQGFSLGLMISVIGGIGLTFCHLRHLRGVWFFKPAIEQACHC